MLEFPKWKYALIVLVLLLSVIYSLPNIFPQEPAVQISVNRGQLDAGLTGRMEPLRVTDLERFDAAFFCNSATPACAIATIGERMFAMRPGLIERLQGAWASNPVQPI